MKALGNFSHSVDTLATGFGRGDVGLDITALGTLQSQVCCEIYAGLPSMKYHKQVVSPSVYTTRLRIDFIIAQNNRSEEHTSELQSRENLVCRLLLEKKKKRTCTNRNALTQT